MTVNTVKHALTWAGEVWAALLGVTTAVGVALWAVQKAWSWMSKGRGLGLGTSLLASWGMLLVNPPTVLLTSFSTRVREAGEVVTG